MPVIQFGCPRCGATAQIDSSMIGRETQCPGCGNQVAVSAGPPVAAGPPPVASGPPPMPGAPPRAGGAPPIAAGSPPPVAGNRPPAPGGLPPVAVGIAPPRAAPMPGAPPVTFAPPPRAAAIPTAAAPGPFVSNAPAAPMGVPNLSTAAEPSASPAGPAAPGRRPLRKLSPEERAQRRLRRNIIMAAACLAILLIAVSLLIKIGG